MKSQISFIKVFFRFEKEEAWLERMSASGWHLISASYGLYKFQQGVPENRVYKIDCRSISRQPDLNDYVSIFNDSGWVCVSPKVYVGNYYFYSLADHQGKDIFSDNASRAGRYYRYAQFSFTSLIPLIPIYAVLFSQGTMKPGNIGYQTPGLWQMTGLEFTTHFLFETPFVILRSLIGFLPVIVFLFALLFTLNFYRIYRKELGK